MSTDRKPGMNDQPELGLARLPALEPPREVLPEILAAVRRARVSRPRRGWFKWAAAAGLVAALGIIGLLAGRIDRQADEVAAWVDYSQQLEARLRLVGGRNGVVRGHRAAALGQLEDRIVSIDLRLAQRPRPPEQLELWRRRTMLLHDLVTVHAGDELLAGEAARQPVVTINPPLGVVPASYEL